MLTSTFHGLLAWPSGHLAWPSGRLAAHYPHSSQPSCLGLDLETLKVTLATQSCACAVFGVRAWTSGTWHCASGPDPRCAYHDRSKSDNRDVLRAAAVPRLTLRHQEYWPDSLAGEASGLKRVPHSPRCPNSDSEPWRRRFRSLTHTLKHCVTGLGPRCRTGSQSLRRWST